MDWLRHAGISERWQSLSRGHADHVNAKLRAGVRDAAASSRDDRDTLANAVLDIVRAANGEGDIRGLRARFSPAHAPFQQHLETASTHVGPLYILDDGRLAVVVGSPWERPQAWVATPESTEPLLGVFALGRSPDRRIYALGRTDGVHLMRGWTSQTQVVLPWPSDYAPVHPDVPFRRPSVSALLPFDDGRRVVVVSRSGAFLLTLEGSTLIHPSSRDLNRYVAEDGDDAFPLDLQSVHGALSPRRSDDHAPAIVVGDQASPHRILSETGDLIAAVEPMSGYASHAMFSADGQTVILSGSNAEDGGTLVLAARALSSELHLSEQPVHWLQGRVTAGVATPSRIALGTPDGFVALYAGAPLTMVGQLYVGGRVLGFDHSADDRRLAVSTDAGTMHLIDLEPSATDAFVIGTVAHCESRRWMFWRGESSPLIW